MAAQDLSPRGGTPPAPLASTVREIGVRERRARDARRRVTEYLGAYGLSDARRLEDLSAEIVACCGERGEGLPQAAVMLAQTRVQDFLGGLFGHTKTAVDPLWLRAFVEAHPAEFLADVERARACAARFGDCATGELPREQPFTPQELPTFRWPSWLLWLLPTLLMVLGSTVVLLRELSRDGLSALELLWAATFAAVVSLPASGLTLSALGLLTRRVRPLPAPSQPASGQDDVRPSRATRSRTAVVLPVYHEDPERVFAAVAAMRESLARHAQPGRFDIYVLSDSRDIMCAADEQRAFRRVAAFADAACDGADIGVYYRRRSRNERQKSGNLADFFERFGGRYEFAIVLDADSLMSGRAMVELVERMRAAPRVGLLQANLLLHRGRTLLARGRQLMASVCGPLFMRGLAQWAGPHGNYYGHNAIVRVQAFLECCALPLLPGRPPFGGHFLSHDFVEAAMLCRGGWEVRAAWDVQESWEEMPQSLHAYAARDRRWCQGNLQHLRIVGVEGLAPMSRVHMLVGALSYLSAPLLLLFLALGTSLSLSAGQAPLSGGLSLLLAAAALCCLLTPRLLGFVDVVLDPERRRQHGGALRLAASLMLEALLSLLITPVLICHHARAVGSVLLGGAVTWGAQRRTPRSELAATLRAELPTMLLGALVGAALWMRAPGVMLWLSPFWLPMLFAAPIAWLVSSPLWGDCSRRLHLLSTPAELAPHPLMQGARERQHLTAADAAARFRDLVLDPLLLSAHLSALSGPVPDSTSVAPALERALRVGPAGLSDGERELLQRDPQSMRRLHREAWRRWPVEACDRGRPLTPTANFAARNT